MRPEDATGNAPHSLALQLPLARLTRVLRAATACAPMRAPRRERALQPRVLQQMHDEARGREEQQPQPGSAHAGAGTQRARKEEGRAGGTEEAGAHVVRQPGGGEAGVR